MHLGKPLNGLVRRSKRSKEDYFTASQTQLIWARFKSQRTTMVAAFVLSFLIFLGIFAPVISPYSPTSSGANVDYTNGAPQWPQFCDSSGCSSKPFIHAVERYRGADTNFRWVTKTTEERDYLTLFPRGWEYRFLGVRLNRHLFGAEDGFINIFGTDAQGKDTFSRTIHAIRISLVVGLVGVLIAFVLALIIGGIAGYFGGWIDIVLQASMDAVKAVPTIPLFMAVAALIPPEWSAETRFMFISALLGLLGWSTLARRVRTHILAERTADYVLAARLSGARAGHIIRRHLLPSFTSYIIVDLVISFPFMVLSETALSFIGLGLKEPVNSLGVLLQNVTRVDVLLNYWWYFIPVPVFVALVLSFVFVGDGLRDAADPYTEKK